MLPQLKPPARFQGIPLINAGLESRRAWGSTRQWLSLKEHKRKVPDRKMHREGKVDFVEVQSTESHRGSFSLKNST